MEELSGGEARRIVLDAQGFGKAKHGRRDVRHVRSVARRLVALQIDSVNVLVRAHYLPAFSRIGPYDRATLDALAYERRELYEYWGRQASLLPVATWPLVRWRMDAHADPSDRFGAWAAANRGYVEEVYGHVARAGPLGVSDLAGAGERSGPWWGWKKGKVALEWLFAVGRVSVAGRRNFERLYDVTERVIPRDVLDAPVAPREEAIRALTAMTVSALGVATAADVADFFVMPRADVRRALAELVEQGSLVSVRVDGWRDVAYTRADVRVPRRMDGCAVVSPFDPLVWNRARTQRLFGFEYRIEIYVPAARRVHGYYVLPVLLGEHLVARVDLKADRDADRLLVRGAYAEDGYARDEVAEALAPELASLRGWLALSGLDVARRGDLSDVLRRAVAGR